MFGLVVLIIGQELLFIEAPKQVEEVHSLQDSLAFDLALLGIEADRLQPIRNVYKLPTVSIAPPAPIIH